MTPCRRWDTGASVGLNLDFARVHTKTQNLIDPCFGAKTWSFPIKTEVKWLVLVRLGIIRSPGPSFEAGCGPPTRQPMAASTVSDLETPAHAMGCHEYRIWPWRTEDYQSYTTCDMFQDVPGSVPGGIGFLPGVWVGHAQSHVSPMECADSDVACAGAHHEDYPGANQVDRQGDRWSPRTILPRHSMYAIYA